MLLLALFAATPAAAQDAPVGIRAAQAGLQARLDNRGAATPPLLSVPADAALLRAATDPAALSALDPGDPASIVAHCTGPNSWSADYSLWGMGPRATSRTELMAQLASPASKANYGRYQDEISLIQRASLVCHNRISLLMDLRIMALPEASRAAAPGLAQLRRGAMELITGLFRVQIDPSVKPANRALLLSALAADPGGALLLLSAEQRASTRAVLRDILANPATSNRAALEAFARAMDAAPCTRLCLVP